MGLYGERSTAEISANAEQSFRTPNASWSESLSFIAISRPLSHDVGLPAFLPSKAVIGDLSNSGSVCDRPRVAYATRSVGPENCIGDSFIGSYAASPCFELRQKRTAGV